MVIDLGLDRQPVPPDPPSGWWRSRHRLRLPAVVATLVLLLGLAGAGPVALPALTEVATHPGDARDFVMIGDRLLVSSADRTVASRWTISAYEMPAGRHLWTTPYESSTGELAQVRRVGDLVLVNGGAVAPGLGPTIVLDAATGRDRWVAPAGLVVVDGSGVGLVSGRTDDPGANGGPGPTPNGGPGPTPNGAETVRGLDLDTGDEVWRATAPAETTIFAAPGGRALLLGLDGRAELRDATDGRVELTRTLSNGGAPQVIGDTLLIRDRRGGDPGVVGYDLATLDRRWGRPVPDGLGRLTQCGRFVCVPGNGTVEAVDPATGEPVWQADETDLVVDFGTYLVTFKVGSIEAGAARIVDPATGRSLGALDDWVTGLDGRGDSTFVGVRRGGENGSSWLGVLPPPADQVRLLGAVPRRVWGCVAGPANIACHSGLGRISIWRYRT